MPLVPGSLAFAVAALCAALMGFAIQRGATCTVAAIDEIVTRRKVARLASLGEATLWVLGGLLVARGCGLTMLMPGGYAVTAWTIAGGALLGLGAYVNGACVFGAIARLGSGEWAYVVTPLGFYAGCVTLPLLFPMPAPRPLPETSPVWAVGMAAGAAFAALVVWRVVRPLATLCADRSGAPLARRLREGLLAPLWAPHAATLVIGITFVILLVVAGAWTYTDVLAELARGMAGSLGARVGLLLALFLGALAGGAMAGRFRSVRPTLARLAKCFAGGLLMGWGSLLIPGGNDGLILVGMPLLWPYAWLAIAAMGGTIAIAQLGQRAIAGRRAAWT